MNSNKNYFDIPILLLIFNRPSTTKKVLEVLKKIRPNKIYVAADGPRNKEEKKLTDATRKIALNSITWKCNINTLFRENNFGCALGVSSAIDWFFSQEEYGIILEDDIILDPSFFKFAKELLIKYKNNKKIMMITANNYLYKSNIKIKESYYFSIFAHIWGWATWKRAWQNFELHTSNFHKNKKELIKYLSKINLPKQTMLNTINFIEKQFIKQKKDSWAIPWAYTILKNKGLVIVPTKNLAKNIGFNKNSTHTNRSRKFIDDNPLQKIYFPLIHPKKIKLNCDADRFNLNLWFGEKWYVILLKRLHLINLALKIRNKLTL